MPDQKLPIIPVEFRRNENFESLYANNIQFENSEWDLKMLFGELDLRDNKIAVEQHTAMNIPWIQAKLLLFFLNVQVAIYEKVNGPIKIPASVLPQEVPPIPEMFKDNPLSEPIRELVTKMRSEFIARLNAETGK